MISDRGKNEPPKYIQKQLRDCQFNYSWALLQKALLGNFVFLIAALVVKVATPASLETLKRFLIRVFSEQRLLI